MMQSIRNSVWILFALLLPACSATKFLSENESFYTGAEIKLEPQERVSDKRDIRKSLEEEIVLKPNTTILGMRPGVWFYYWGGAESKPKGIKGWFKRKLGQEPVLLKDVEPEQTARILQGNLVNDGYFESQVSSSVKTKNKKSEVTYTVELYPPFRIRNVNYPSPRDSVYKAVVKTIEEESFVKTEQRFNLELLKEEMERIESLLENYGFYYFDDRYLLYEADTTVGQRQVDLYFTLEKDIPQKAKRIYRIREVNVITDFSLSDDTLQYNADTLKIDGYNYIDKEEKFRPRVITNVINLKRGNIYTRDDHDYTLSHLMGLGAFKFVNIKYREVPADSAELDAYVYLTPLLKKSIRIEAQATSKSNNFVGPGLGVTFTNRNFLGGSERFELKVNSSYEWQISRQQSGPLNAFEMDAEASLSVPRFMAPVRINYASSKYIPHTKFKLGFNIQNRINFFQLNSFNATYGYTWRETTSKSHEFYPVDVTYVNLNKTSQEFDDLLDENPVLENSFQNQFIMGGRYSFTLNTQLSDKARINLRASQTNSHDFYLKTNLDFAGNVMQLLQGGHQEGELNQLLGQPYSQFVMGNVDFRYYWQFDTHNKLASRLIVGMGKAYGNSTQLPYVKQFASGGSNSIRAFPARSLGPGTYYARNDPDFAEQKTYFIDQRGDIKLEASVEYRFDIIKSWKGAVFMDAGNIWVWDDEGDERPGGKFNTDTFINEIAVGTGVGFRFDFNFFVLRFDLAFPLRKPYLNENERWVIDDIDFTDSDWRSENLVFNIAIGYPF